MYFLYLCSTEMICYLMLKCALFLFLEYKVIMLYAVSCFNFNSHSISRGGPKIVELRIPQKMTWCSVNAN